MTKAGHAALMAILKLHPGEVKPWGFVCGVEEVLNTLVREVERETLERAAEVADKHAEECDECLGEEMPERERNIVIGKREGARFLATCLFSTVFSVKRRVKHGVI